MATPTFIDFMRAMAEAKKRGDDYTICRKCLAIRKSDFYRTCEDCRMANRLRYRDYRAANLDRYRAADRERKRAKRLELRQTRDMFRAQREQEQLAQGLSPCARCGDLKDMYDGHVTCEDCRAEMRMAQAARRAKAKAGQ